MVSGIPNPEPKVSGIPNLDLRIPESYQKSGIPVSIPEVVQHCGLSKCKVFLMGTLLINVCFCRKADQECNAANFWLRVVVSKIK